jgi:hypothetical protein
MKESTAAENFLFQFCLNFQKIRKIKIIRDQGKYFQNTFHFGQKEYF